MISIEQYKKIQECKEFGLSINKTCKKLGLSYNAVSNWWNKSIDDFHEKEKGRGYTLDCYRQYIIDLLKICPQISNTTVRYRLMDEFDDFDVPYSTFFRYMKRLRTETGLIKPKRKCDTFRETEPGYEAQVDFGQYKMKNMYGGHTTVYFFVMILSYSRMKFAYFSTTPFTAKTACEAHDYAFKYFGGRTQTIMYDNDKVFVASETIGNIMLVKEFEKYVIDRGFSTVFCHAYDPSTKGKVESTVNIIKRTFLDGRIFCGIDRLNMECLDWLDKVINKIENDKTKELPSVLFQKEYKYLQKVYFGSNVSSIVSLINGRYVLYDGNHYQIPENSVDANARIRLDVQDDMLLMYNASNNDLIYKTKTVSGKGTVVNVSEYLKTHPLEDEIKKQFDNNPKVCEFIELLRKQRNSYFFEQCRRIMYLCNYYSNEEILHGIDYCFDVQKHTAYELTCFLFMEYGEERIKKVIKPHVFSNYRNRAMQIREELNNA